MDKREAAGLHIHLGADSPALADPATLTSRLRVTSRGVTIDGDYVVSEQMDRIMAEAATVPPGASGVAREMGAEFLLGYAAAVQDMMRIVEGANEAMKLLLDAHQAGDATRVCAMLDRMYALARGAAPAAPAGGRMH